MPSTSDLPYDALLFLSFGAPDGPDDVLPFLENVTRGRGIPRERLVEVGAHYAHFGGRSPLNDLNRAMIAAIRDVLAERGHHIPVYFGNRNWHPLVEDTVAEMVRDGVTNALVFTTSAWAGYSGCRQYDEDIARARVAVPGAPRMEKLRQFYDHPLFVDAFVEELRVAEARIPGDRRDRARLVFTAHSVPTAADAAAGPRFAGGNLYSRQVAEASRLVAEAVGRTDFDLVWQSRSGPPEVPWLEPDILDHLAELHGRGEDTVLVCPIGFISDHIEVVWDLDAELRAEAERLGVHMERVPTPGYSEAFARMVVELVEERVHGIEPRRLGELPDLGGTVDGSPCAADCCVPLSRRPA